MKYKIELFKTARGDAPVSDLIIQQNKQTIAKILRVITLLEESGPLLQFPYSKKIGNYLYELRVSGKDTVRIFYVQHNNTFYLLHAFKKKTQKTPMKEIKIALDRSRELI